MKRLLIFFWNLLRPRRDSDDERLRAALLRCCAEANTAGRETRPLQEVEG